MRTVRACSELAISRELSTITWVLADLKAGKGVRKFYNVKREGFRCALTGS